MAAKRRKKKSTKSANGIKAQLTRIEKKVDPISKYIKSIS